MKTAFIILGLMLGVALAGPGCSMRYYDIEGPVPAEIVSVSAAELEATIPWAVDDLEDVYYGDSDAACNRGPGETAGCHVHLTGDIVVARSMWAMQPPLMQCIQDHQVVAHELLHRVLAHETGDSDADHDSVWFTEALPIAQAELLVYCRCQLDREAVEKEGVVCQ